MRSVSYIKHLGGLHPLPTTRPLTDIGVVTVARKLGNGLLWMKVMLFSRNRSGLA